MLVMFSNLSTPPALSARWSRAAASAAVRSVSRIKVKSPQERFLKKIYKNETTMAVWSPKTVSHGPPKSGPTAGTTDPRGPGAVHGPPKLHRLTGISAPPHHVPAWRHASACGPGRSDGLSILGSAPRRLASPLPSGAPVPTPNGLLRRLALDGRALGFGPLFSSQAWGAFAGCPRAAPGPRRRVISGRPQGWRPLFCGTLATLPALTISRGSTLMSCLPFLRFSFLRCARNCSSITCAGCAARPRAPIIGVPAQAAADRLALRARALQASLKVKQRVAATVVAAKSVWGCFLGGCSPSAAAAGLPRVLAG